MCHKQVSRGRRDEVDAPHVAGELEACMTRPTKATTRMYGLSSVTNITKRSQYLLGAPGER